MCGIAGIISKTHLKEAAIRRMVNTMRRRGPDDSGVHSNDDIAIGMTRLAIIDLSPLGHQPMRSHCQRYWIVYNGECYNFQKLRKELEMLGSVFVGNSDTEVVLEAYAKFGKVCLAKMEGMFAFAIWDEQEKKVFAARDRFGIKPFYYITSSGGFCFASEVKTLLSSGLMDFVIDQEAVLQYFTFGHIIQPKTIMEGITALMPGHYLEWKNDDLKITSYWKLKKNTFAGDYTEAKRGVMNHLLRSVQSQMVSDRPLGLFLSGGLDSASLLFAMSKLGYKTNSFSIGFEDNPYVINEEKYARELASHFGTKHFQVNINGDLAADHIFEYFDSTDQPTIDGLNTFFVSKYAVQEMTVALNGLGGDELFGGYARHARAFWKSKNMGLIQQLLNPIARAGARVGSNGAFSFFTKAVFHTESRDPLRNYMLSRVMNFPDIIGDLPQPVDSIRWSDFYKKQMAHFSDVEGVDFFDQNMNYEMQGFMSSMILRDSDPISMYHSLEVRFPFIDTQFVEFAFGLPASMKIKTEMKEKPGSEGNLSYVQTGAKRVLLETVSEYLPENFGNRPKNGFKLPLNQWLRHQLKGVVADILNDKNQIGFSVLNHHTAEEMSARFYNAQDAGLTFWSVIAFLGNISALKKHHVSK